MATQSPKKNAELGKLNFDECKSLTESSYHQKKACGTLATATQTLQAHLEIVLDNFGQECKGAGRSGCGAHWPEKAVC